jgi:hypothetical protein
MYTIEAKMSNGKNETFNDLTDLFRWLAHYNLEPDENGWTELNEYCERRVAYAVDDAPADPSCEMLVQCHIPGAAHKFINESEDA